MPGEAGLTGSLVRGHWRHALGVGAASALLSLRPGLSTPSLPTWGLCVGPVGYMEPPLGWLLFLKWPQVHRFTRNTWASWVVLVLKKPPASSGDIRDVGSIPGSGRSLGGGHSNPLQYPCLENPMDRGAWRATVHRVTKSWTRLK